MNFLIIVSHRSLSSWRCVGRLFLGAVVLPPSTSSRRIRNSWWQRTADSGGSARRRWPWRPVWLTDEPYARGLRPAPCRYMLGSLPALGEQC
ncbi:hypothetical protein V5799_021225 [Amblyomma americanum]|uniref:Uncharacterized protein n=1 Tax=Amblyomma americanum TaxID=6943 RepID=A0AAQ4FNW0_AMBAM